MPNDFQGEGILPANGPPRPDMVIGGTPNRPPIFVEVLPAPPQVPGNLPTPVTINNPTNTPVDFPAFNAGNTTNPDALTPTTKPRPQPKPPAPAPDDIAGQIEGELGGSKPAGQGLSLAEEDAILGNGPRPAAKPALKPTPVIPAKPVADPAQGEFTGGGQDYFEPGFHPVEGGMLEIAYPGAEPVFHPSLPVVKGPPVLPQEVTPVETAPGEGGSWGGALFVIGQAPIIFTVPGHGGRPAGHYEPNPGGGYHWWSGKDDSESFVPDPAPPNNSFVKDVSALGNPFNPLFTIPDYITGLLIKPKKYGSNLHFPSQQEIADAATTGAGLSNNMQTMQQSGQGPFNP